MLEPLVKPNLLERFEAFSIPVPESGCWLWTNSVNNKGYAHICINNKATFAHRASYEFFKGPIPKGMEVCHSCDIPSCINPAHLYLATHAENMLHSALKGRSRGGNIGGYEHHQSVLTPEKVKIIRETFIPAKRLAKEWGISAATIRKCRRRESYKNG